MENKIHIEKEEINNSQNNNIPIEEETKENFTPNNIITNTNTNNHSQIKINLLIQKILMI